MALSAVQLLAVAVAVVLTAAVDATPPGIAKNPSHATCKIKKYKHCYNLVHVCPKFCPDQCTVECASCKPICSGGSNPPPEDSPPATPSPSSPPPSAIHPPPSPATTTPPPATPAPATTPPPPATPAPVTTPPPPATPALATTPPPPSAATPSPPNIYPSPPPSPRHSPSPPRATPAPAPPTPSLPNSPPPPTTPRPPTAKTPPTPPAPATPTPPLSPPHSPSPPPATPAPTPPTPSIPNSPPPPTTPSPPTTKTPPTPPALATSPPPTPGSSPTPQPPSTPPSLPPPPPTSTTPPSPQSPDHSSPPSSSAGAAKRVRCRNVNYPQCYNMMHTCPTACPAGCGVDCVACKPVCKCDMPGAVCQAPRFIGGDGITFYFHGKKNQNFCLVSDPNLHINARFIGKRNPNLNRDFTWVQSLGILFHNHELFIGAQETAAWDDSVDRLSVALNGLPIALPESEGSQWRSPNSSRSILIVRLAAANNIMVEAEGLFRITAKVVPITKEDSRIHNYGITEDNSFAHLDVGFKFFSLSSQVNGVLGQTYSHGYTSRVNVKTKMAVMGRDEEFETSSLFAADCAVARYGGRSGSGEEA